MSACAAYRPEADIPLPAKTGQSALRPQSPLAEVVRPLESGRVIGGAYGRFERGKRAYKVPFGEGPECVPKPLFHRERSLHRPKRSYASCDSSASASAISGISGVGAKPSSAEPSTECASAWRRVDW
jgi:hypothetical protein